MSIDSAVGKLRAADRDMRDDPPNSIKAKDDVLEEYQPIFQFQEIGELTKQEFKDFLLFENNRHWTGLHRKRSMMTEDMDRLRDGLQTLVNEEKDLASRVQTAKEQVDGMGKATISAILVTAFPDKYGVWNNRSEEALKQLDVWPDFERGSDFGHRYVRVNDVLLNLSNELDLDLWELDALLGYVVKYDEDQQETIEDTEATGEFVKERHLHQYLINHWEQMEFSEEWEIYSDADDPEAGVEFSTGIGRPDILLTHTSEPKVCVLELKKGSTSDRAVGQLLRYVGWVRGNLKDLEGVSPNADVEGRLVVNEPSEKLEYAISVVPELMLYEYEMQVTLNQSA
ncbi:hypothetical protein AArcCO_4024 (plasmid) [Halalkaliarchaeum sp. AArc-CO]|uniref:hypothetical protein n=1 Tax=Halalkaliarchaeum sp. AArc-CO TaxID=2866381 RepID=UPI00217ECEC7|nr:hypothetical protein [Halalkaliarchaeum sp. AArc-CO]UWG49199.1 hypothetical protein AArcCO_4024 [Halalkaliarchaeum sp. AArc-CO]